MEGNETAKKEDCCEDVLRPAPRPEIRPFVNLSIRSGKVYSQGQVHSRHEQRFAKMSYFYTCLNQLSLNSEDLYTDVE